MASVSRVEEMPVYQLFYQLALDVEKATRNFPYAFRWLRSQVLRSSESVPANMTEGFYSQYSTEYLQSLYRCRREGRETTTHLCYARDVGQLRADVVGPLLVRYEDALEQLSLLIGSIESKIKKHGKSKPGSNVVKESPEPYEVSPDHQPLTINHSLPPSTINHSPPPLP